MKRLLLALGSVVTLAVPTRADEGMWMPEQIPATPMPLPI